MADYQPPPVPDIRRARGPEWRLLWNQAHHVMRAYGRTPSMHLIDGLLDSPERRWLRAHLDGIALVTTGPEGRVQDNERLCFRTTLWNPASMKRERIRVIVEPTGHEIMNAFPE